MHSHRSESTASEDGVVVVPAAKRLRRISPRPQQGVAVVDLTAEEGGTPVAQKLREAGYDVHLAARQLGVTANASNRPKRLADALADLDGPASSQELCWGGQGRRHRHSSRQPAVLCAPASSTEAMGPPLQGTAAAAVAAAAAEAARMQQECAADGADVVVVGGDPLTPPKADRSRNAPVTSSIAAAAAGGAAGPGSAPQHILGNPPMWPTGRRPLHAGRTSCIPPQSRPVGASHGATAAALPLLPGSHRRRLSVRSPRDTAVAGGSSSSTGRVPGGIAALAASELQAEEDAAVAARLQAEEDARLAQQMVDVEQMREQENRLQWLQDFEQQANQVQAHHRLAAAAAAAELVGPPAAGGRRTVRGRRVGHSRAPPPRDPLFGALLDDEGLQGAGAAAAAAGAAGAGRMRNGWGMLAAEALLAQLAGERGARGSSSSGRGGRGRQPGGSLALPQAMREAMAGMRVGLSPALLFSDRDFTADDYEALCRLDDTVENRKGAATTTIEALPTQTVPAGGLVGDNGEKLSCAVCLEEFCGGAQLRGLPCMHRFHAGCIDRWLQQKASCPICQRAVGSS